MATKPTTRTTAAILADIIDLVAELAVVNEDIKLNRVDSSNIDSVGYNFAQSRLRVQFHNGSVYDYADVPQHVYEELISASSVGSYFNAGVKDVYATTKVQ